MSEKVRYVIADKYFQLDCSYGASAQDVLEGRVEFAQDAQEYPLIYKLVPVSLASVKRQAAKERAERKVKK